MKNIAAQKALKNSALKKIDQYGVLDVVPHHEFHLLHLDQILPLERKLNLFFKRAFDLITSSVLLISLFCWIFPLFALLIKLDSKGPVLFFQKRNKKNGKLFTCIKFRTMVMNDEADYLPATENDQRITLIGKFLRRHHLDELPQLLNVWWGDMSLIGPRPYMIRDNENYAALVKNYRIRYRVKPGITGYAQVHNYINPLIKPEDIEERVNKDFYYIHNWSLGLDAKILCRTFFKMLGLNKQA